MNKKEYLDTLGKALGAMPYKDVNEILCVAGMPVIIPEEPNKKEVEVII